MSVPAIRFKEFSGDWESEDLINVCNKIMDGTHFSPKSNEGTKKYLTSKNIRNTGLDISDCNYISEEEHQEIYRKCPVKLGDILLTKDGANTGNCCINTLHEEFSLLSSVAVLSGKEGKLNNIFLLQLFQSHKGINTINNAMAGQAISRITLEKINKFRFSFPSLPEQTKIANFLTAVDEKITLLTQKATLLSQYKKGVMQQIFSQELRFKDDDGQEFPEWEEKTLGELYSITSSKRVFQNEWTKTGVPFYRAREVVKLSENGFVDNELFISTEMFLEYKTKYGVPQENDLIVTGVGTIGRMYVVKASDKFYFKDGNIIWFKVINNVADSQFVKQLFQSPIIKKQIEGNASITTVGTYTIDSAKKTLIPYPSIPEQTKIANLLTAIDEKITTNQTQLNSVKQYKQGLLQQMFV